MATVGFREIYRYGGKFFGYLLVVEGLAAAFLIGGGYLASRVMTLTDPSMSALSQTEAFVGVFLMAVGAVLALIGWFGLAHKLLTESLERALGAHEAELAVSPSPASDASEARDEAESASESEPEPAPVESGSQEPPTEPAAGPATDPSPRMEQDSSTMDETASSGGHQDGRGQSAPVEPTTTQPPVDEGSTPEPPTESPDPTIAPGDVGTPPEPAGDEPTDAAEDDSPPEWTPPDPSEFESPSEPEQEAPADEPAGNQSADASTDPEPGAADDVDGEDVDPDEVPDDETLADEGVESFRTGGEDDPLADRLPGDEE